MLQGIVDMSIPRQFFHELIQIYSNIIELRSRDMESQRHLICVPFMLDVVSHSCIPWAHTLHCIPFEGC